LRFADVMALARDYLKVRRFDKLLEIARLSLESIHPDDHVEVSEWLLRLKIHAL